MLGAVDAVYQRAQFRGFNPVQYSAAQMFQRMVPGWCPVSAARLSLFRELACIKVRLAAGLAAASSAAREVRAYQIGFAIPPGSVLPQTP